MYGLFNECKLLTIEKKKKKKKNVCQWIGTKCAFFFIFFYKEPSIGTSYQVLVHLTRRFQRRRFFFRKSKSQKQELPVVAIFVNYLGRNE